MKRLCAMLFLFFIVACQPTVVDKINEADVVNLTTGDTAIFDANSVLTVETYWYVWEPKEDITCYELSQAIQALLSQRRGVEVVEKFPLEVQRHFRKETW